MLMLSDCSEEVSSHIPHINVMLAQRMLTYWNPDITEIPPCGGTSFDSLERVDASTEAGLKRIRELVLAEVPFKAYNHPKLNEVVEKYKNWEEVVKKFETVKSHSATASHNHFMW